jgi:CRISPR system Cascade subunit CasC
MNMQKSAVFGGVRRVRISSQSLKRAIRNSDYYREYLGEASTRTRSLEKLKIKFSEELKNEFPVGIVHECVDRFVRAKASEEIEGEESEVEAANSSGKKENRIAVAPWVLNEVRELCAILGEIKKQGLNDEELAKVKEKFSKQKRKKTEQELIDEVLDKKIKNEMEEKKKSLQLALASAIDIALSGRMTTSGLTTSVDGALAVAHAITTHGVDSDIDWFTAVDDLVVDAGGIGAGHLNTQEFSSGTFYRYASLNIGQLQENLGAVPRERVLEIAKHLVHLLATVVPSAKQQSFAAHNLADCVLVSFADIPVSLANAFEEPIAKGKAGGFKGPSIGALLQYWQQVHKGYGLDEQVALFALDNPNSVPEGMASQHSLAELTNWVRHDGQI